MKQPLIICLVCIMLAAGLFIWGFGASPATSPAVPERQYALLIESDTGTFLMQLRKGAQEAAAEQGARVFLENLEADVAAQARSLSARGITAALLLLSDPLPVCHALAEEGVPYVVVGEELRGQICVMADDAEAGKALLERALSMVEPAQVLLLTDPADTHAHARANGAEVLRQKQQVSTLAWPQDASAMAGYHALVATNASITRALADMKSSGALPQSTTVLGVDTGDLRVTDLESGLVQAMIVDNPYALGYVALQKALLANEESLQPSFFTCASTLIDLSNMYLSENVKLVFPLLQ